MASDDPARVSRYAAGPPPTRRCFGHGPQGRARLLVGAAGERDEAGGASRLAPLTAFLRAGRVANTVPLACRRSATRQETESFNEIHEFGTHCP
jgi:hypothetical protein